MTATPTRLSRRLACTALLVAMLGACSSTPTDRNDTPPVKSKADAQTWAQQITEHMARTAGIEIDPTTVDALFTPCTGRNGETATDDRYILMYSVKSSVPRAQHPEAVRKVRDMLVGEGLTVEGYREFVDGKPDALVDAVHPNSRYTATAETSGSGDRMYLGIITPCLLPPPASVSPTSTS
ncbi:hypothetical protein BX285_2621 [Streptomyces sp. 1114.5]|uniref:hypothetical protein n=1 Tax=unclassified Streptomyces TaxID=2593676 RepID=UPI000BC95E5D|nr:MULTISPECIES: hypothetical protein [unclassified Streptomyces]RKT18203.1 hypothetical protein BX285_2621 [Streptomyces sp. 1114.5]SOB84402.1 hypothetical protein SAMN06272789_4652 [Streptomyces sp. 1331.2]